MAKEDYEHHEEIRLLTIDEFIDATYCNGNIFRWIDIEVSSVEDDCVILTYTTSRDTTSEIDKTVYFERGQGPFGIKMACGKDGKPKNMKRS
jgi:hypothetical protein